MLNNKKNLLQRVRIAMVAIVTIMSVGGAFAMAPTHNNALQTWGVLVTNSNSYQVTAVTAGSFCTGTARVCTVQSTATPDANGDIPKNETSDPKPGIFTK